MNIITIAICMIGVFVSGINFGFFVNDLRYKKQAKDKLNEIQKFYNEEHERMNREFYDNSEKES